MQTSLFNNTPTITVQDNRGQTVRQIQYLRHPDTPDKRDEFITRYQYNALGFLAHSIDPRLYQQQQTDDTIQDNFSYLTSLSGEVLSVESVDAGMTVTMKDVAQRPYFAVNATAHTCYWQYEDKASLGRLLAISEQPAGEAAQITERFVWAGNSQTEKDWNLVGACVRHYDTAGLEQTHSLALTGTMLSTSRRLLQDELDANWQGEDESAWDTLLSPAVYTNHYSVDASGAILTSTDAMGNMQRQAYDVAGMLMASWLTLKAGSEQVIVKSLTYAANGQKLREEHGNGIVTSYIYEPQTQRLINIKTERPASHPAGAKILQDLRYEYDPVGNVLRISNDAEATRFWRNQKIVPENHYYYDSLYRLVQATGREMANIGQQTQQLPPASPLDSNTYTNYTRNYTYDFGGNLSQIRHSAPASNNNYTVNITVSNRSNRAVLSTLTEDPTQVDSLFTAGGQQQQLLSGQGLTWTPRGELLTVTLAGHSDQPADIEWYRYDSNSQRVVKTTDRQNGNSSQTQQVIYLAGAELRTSSNDNTVKELLEITLIGEAGRAQVRALHWEMGRPAQIINDQLRYSYDDQLGSSRLEVDANGLLISQEEYYPYGGTSVLLAISQLEVNYKTIRYSGKELDASGLYYYGYRYYQPWVGRWLSADPAGTVDGLNLYRMCRNNPVTLVDEKGMAPSALQKNVDKTVKHTIKTIDKALNVLQSNNNAVNQVMSTFFGHASDELKETWRQDLTAIQNLMKSFDVNKNIIEHVGPESDTDVIAQTAYFFPEKKKLNYNKAMSAGENQISKAKIFKEASDFFKNEKYLEVFEKTWFKYQNRGAEDVVEITLIHEFSHIVLGTLDIAYSSTGGSAHQNIHALQILATDKTFNNTSALVYSFDKFISSKSSLKHLKFEDYYELPYNNADSFAYATQLLAYSASKKSSRQEQFKSMVSNRY